MVQLAPGTYYTACKFQMVGDPIDVRKFTVTGVAATPTGDEQVQLDAAVANYLVYVKDQVRSLVAATKTLVTDYEAGNDDKARAEFSKARSYYEAIEPTAEQFGDLDPKIDYREVDALAEGLDWTGFHRIEKDLWAPKPGDLNADGTDALAGWTPSTPDARKGFGDGLNADVAQLSTLVNDPAFTVTIADISNGAIGLLDEVAANKITGEEDWWSHTDLSDFKANVEGAEVAFGILKDIASAKSADGAALVTKIAGEFASLDTLLAKYVDAAGNWTPYDQVTDSQRKELSDQVNALSEPLSQLTTRCSGSPPDGSPGAGRPAAGGDRRDARRVPPRALRSPRHRCRRPRGRRRRRCGHRHRLRGGLPRGGGERLIDEVPVRRRAPGRDPHPDPGPAPLRRVRPRCEHDAR